MVNKAVAKAIKAVAQEKFICLKCIYNAAKDNPRVDSDSLKSDHAEIDITANIWNHDKALFDKGMRNYTKAMAVPPSPALDEEAILYADGRVNDGQIVWTRTVVQLSESEDIVNMCNKENREEYEEYYKMLGKSWWKKEGGASDRA